MNVLSLFSRTRQTFRDSLHLQLATVGGLVIAFACLGATLFAVTNLSRVENYWKRSRRVTVYLQGEAKSDQISSLRIILESLPEIKQVQYVSPENARSKLSDPALLGAEAGSLPTASFPASLELSFRSGVSEERLEQIAGRVRGHPAVQEVDIYRDWFNQLDSLLNASCWAAGLLALLVALCVLAVIGHTVRLTVIERREQIEVQKLCGATNGFVRGPFVIEGIAQGMGAALIAVLLMLVAYAAWHSDLTFAFSMLAGIPPAFLDPITMTAMVAAAGAVGGLGSVISTRRYLKV